MPKTNFLDGGTPVPASWFNGQGNHTHDGVDADGSAPKVDLENHTNLDFGTSAPKGATMPAAWGLMILGDGSGMPGFFGHTPEHLGAVTRTAVGTYRVTCTAPDLEDALYWGAAFVTPFDASAPDRITAECNHVISSSDWYIDIKTYDSGGSLVDTDSRYQLMVMARRS